MATYRVKPGKFHGARNEYKPGDLVELSAAEAMGFLDKLEPVQETLQAEAAPAEAPEQIQQPAAVKEPKPAPETSIRTRRSKH